MSPMAVFETAPNANVGPIPRMRLPTVAFNAFDV